MTKRKSGCYSGGTKAKGGERIDCAAMTIVFLLSSASDLRQYRISNHLILAGWLAGLFFRWYRQGLWGAGEAMLCAAVSIAAGLPVYRLHGMGAGDVKLLSVVCVMHGVKMWICTGVIFGLLAAVASLLYMVRGQILRKRIKYLLRFLTSGARGTYYDAARDGREAVIPLAPVMAAAYYIAYLYMSLCR